VLLSLVSLLVLLLVLSSDSSLGYQFAITLGLLIASCVDYATQNRKDSGSYRIPVALQLLWSLVLAAGLFWLPESPRYFVMKGKLDQAASVLERIRDQPKGSGFV
jgi:hypothetical protein